MDKPLIKAVLIIAFLVSLGYVFVSAFRSLRDASPLSVDVPPPPPPKFTDKPALKADATAEQTEAYIKQMQQAISIDKQAVDMYVQQVDAFAKNVNAHILSEEIKNRHVTGRLAAFERVIKDTLGPLVIAPLLAALLIYSGIKAAGDVAMARATGGAEKHIDAS